MTVGPAGANKGLSISRLPATGSKALVADQSHLYPCLCFWERLFQDPGSSEGKLVLGDCGLVCSCLCCPLATTPGGVSP